MLQLKKWLGKYLKSKKYNLDLWLDVFEKSGFLNKNQRELFLYYDSIVEFDIYDIKNAKFDALEYSKLFDIKKRIHNLRCFIHEKENSAFLFAVEVLTEDGIKKFLKKKGSSIKAKQVQKIRAVHFMLLKKVID